MNYIILLLFIAYMTLIVSLGYFRPEGKRSKYLIRKSVHMITGLAIFYLTFKVSRQTLLFLFIAGTLFSFITFFIKRFNYIHVTGEASWGTLFYPLGILTSFLLLYNKPIYYFQVVLLFLAISDTVANIGGYRVRGNPQFSILGENKTLFGTIGFALTAFFIALLLLPASDTRTVFYLVLTVVCAIHFEIISYKGSDNIAIPIGTALFFLVTHEQRFNAAWITFLILAMVLVSILLYRSNILTKKGAFGAYLLGVYLFGILGLNWGIPVAFFFVTSVIFTRIRASIDRKVEDTGQRNIWQVIANIFGAIVFSVLFLIFAQPIFKILFMTVVAAVIADTWASEIGPLFHKKCFSIAHWRTATSGVSGGISIAGTLAAFSGSFLVALLSWSGLLQGIDFRMVMIIAMSGFLASFVDTILGAFVEPHLEQMSYFTRKKGVASISPNDVVNLLASSTAPAFFLLLSTFL